MLMLMLMPEPPSPAGAAGTAGGGGATSPPVPAPAGDADAVPAHETLMPACGASASACGAYRHTHVESTSLVECSTVEHAHVHNSRMEDRCMGMAGHGFLGACMKCSCSQAPGLLGVARLAGT